MQWSWGNDAISESRRLSIPWLSDLRIPHCFGDKRVLISEGKILENVSLEVDLNIENFRGLPLKSPWIIIPNSPLNFIPWPWKLWPQTCLEIRGFSRVPLENPWNVFGTLILENPWNSRRRLPLTLIDPWNSTSRSRNLEIQGHNCSHYLKLTFFDVRASCSSSHNFKTIASIKKILSS